MKTPIALFVYNRPEHVLRCLDSLRRCPQLDDCRVIAFCDGPRGAEDREQVARARAIVWRSLDRLGGEVVERATNWGLAASIISGVTELCARHGRVIVMEDDLEVAPCFLRYMLGGLARYEAEAVVHQISGHMFPVGGEGTADAFLLPMTTTWGWATWARAWSAFDARRLGATAFLADEAMRHRFDLNGSYPYSKMLEDRLAGRNQSWGILWWRHVFSLGGLTLFPSRSLVWNGGFDGSGTHCGPRRWHDDREREAVRRATLSPAIQWPERGTVDYEAFQRVTTYLRHQSRGGRRGPPGGERVTARRNCDSGLTISARESAS